MAKKLLSSLAVAGVVLALTGCGGGGGNAAADCDGAPSGASSEKVTASGDAGSVKAEFDAPLTATETERTVLTAGTGDPAEVGSIVTVDIAAFNATTGEAVTALTAADQPFTIGTTFPIFDDALTCATKGERIAAVIPPIPNIAQAGDDVGLSATDSVVVIFDVTDVAAPVDVLPRADGEDQPAPAGFPTVTLADDGAPTITMPTTPPPTETQIAVLKQGDGATVEDGANVTVHYTGAIYATGAVFDSSWTRGEPATFPTSGVIAGFSEALVGQKVGSQVIAVIPPAEGYGDTPPEGSGISATDTLVFVVDILATQ